MATLKQKKVVKKILENPGKPVSKAMKEAGYATPSYRNPQELTNSKGWKELMDEHFSDADLGRLHAELLNSTRLDHMIFPLGPKTAKEGEVIDKLPETLATILDAEMALQRTTLSDDDIKDLLKSVNCTVRKIVHGETARHVYFWSADNKARKEGLDMAYKLKGKYAAEKTLHVNIDVDTTMTPEDLELLKLIKEYDRNPRTAPVPLEGHLPDGLDAQPQNQDQ